MKLKQWFQRFLLWIGAVGMLLAFGGCGGASQPATAIPVSLGAKQMVETASQSQATADSNTATPDSVDLYRALGVPQTYTAELQSETGLLKVHVDAAVELPTADLPVERTKRHLFTNEEVARIASVLLGSDVHYVDQASAGEHFTKAFLQREIDDLSDSIAYWDSYGNIKYTFVTTRRTRRNRRSPNSGRCFRRCRTRCPPSRRTLPNGRQSAPRTVRERLTRRTATSHTSPCRMTRRSRACHSTTARKCSPVAFSSTRETCSTRWAP